MRRWRAGWVRSISREEFVGLCVGVIGYVADDIAKPRLWIDVVQASGLDERIDDSGAAAAFIRAGEQIVLSSEGQRPHCAIGGVVSHFEAPITDVARQRGQRDIA